MTKNENLPLFPLKYIEFLAHLYWKTQFLSPEFVIYVGFEAFSVQKKRRFITQYCYTKYMFWSVLSQSPKFKEAKLHILYVFDIFIVLFDSSEESKIVNFRSSKV